MTTRLWLLLPHVVRWIVLLGVFAATCALTILLHWGTLPATPFYPVVLLSIVVGTERQGYVITGLSVGASIVFAQLLHVSTPLSQTSTDSALLLLVAVTLIVAMHQRRTSERLTKAVVYETGVIKALGNYALTRLTRDEMMRAIVRYLANSTDASIAVVVMPDPTDSSLMGYVDANGIGLGPDPIERSVAHSVAGHVFSSGQAKVVANTAKDPEFQPVVAMTIGSLIAVPLLLAGQPIGVIAVGKKQINGFVPDDVRLLETLARTLAVPLYASRPARAGDDRARASR